MRIFRSSQGISTSSIVAIRMQLLSLVLALVGSINAFPTSNLGERDGQCSQIQIPVTVAEKRSILNITIKDDWDAASLTFSLTARDFGKPDDPLPITGESEFPVWSNYTVGATLCGTGGTILVTTHGIVESKSCVFKFIDADSLAILTMDQVFPTKFLKLVSIQLRRCCSGSRVQCAELRPYWSRLIFQVRFAVLPQDLYSNICQVVNT